MPIHASQGAKTLSISNMDVGCSKWGRQPQPWHHNIMKAQPCPYFILNSASHLHMYFGIRVHPYAHPQHLKVLNTLYLLIPPQTCTCLTEFWLLFSLFVQNYSCGLEQTFSLPTWTDFLTSKNSELQKLSRGPKGRKHKDNTPKTQLVGFNVGIRLFGVFLRGAAFCQIN